MIVQVPNGAGSQNCHYSLTKGSKVGEWKADHSQAPGPIPGFHFSKWILTLSSSSSVVRPWAEIQAQLPFALLGLPMDKLLLHLCKKTAASGGLRFHLRFASGSYVIVPVVVDREVRLH